MISRPRSLLYVPATSTRLLARASQRGADAIVLDLEDAIPPGEKLSARASLANTIESFRGAVPVWVRVNNQSDLIFADVDACVAAGCNGIVVPKVESAADVRRVADHLAGLMSCPASARTFALQAIIETPKGLLRLDDIVSASPLLTSLAFGSEDFSTALGITPTPDAMRMPAQTVAIAAASAELHPMGLAGSIAGYTNISEFEQIARLSRELGMHGAACIHPAQLPALHGVFGATAKEKQNARDLIAAYDEAVANGMGAVAFDGCMIDAPVAERAREMLMRAGELA